MLDFLLRQTIWHPAVPSPYRLLLVAPHLHERIVVLTSLGKTKSEMCINWLKVG